MNHFLYKLIPPRPTFAADMTESEAQIMGEHIAYWQGLTDRRVVVAFGPVDDPAGSWGFGVVEAESEDDVRKLGADDPAVKSRLATFEVYGLPGAVVRG